MTGPEHYREAERLVLGVLHEDDFPGFGEGGEALIAAAQVHATLALAAATAMADTDPNGSGMSLADYETWRVAAGVKKVERPTGGVSE